MDPYDFNCAHCVQAYELARRGVPVEATGLPTEYFPGVIGTGGWNLSEVEKAWGVTFQQAAPKQIVRAFQEAGLGARGFVAVLWRFGGGHLFNVENAGQVQFVDPQTGDADVAHYFQLAEWSAFARSDTATPGSEVLAFVRQQG